MTLPTLFGNDPGPILKCQACTGCCMRLFEEMPETIYGKIHISRLGTDIKFEMRKAYLYDPDSCDLCSGQAIVGVGWSSYYWSAVDDGTTNPNSSDEVCCVQMSLSVSCKSDNAGSGGQCEWSWGINWSGGESLTFLLTDMGPGGSSGRGLSSCNPIEGTWTILGLAEAAACVLAGDPGNTAVITISESALSGSSTPCRWSCCHDAPYIYYATLISPCPKLNGRVVPLYREGGAWVGFVNDENCCPENFCGIISIIYSHSTWSVDDTECGAVCNIDVGSCGGLASLFINTGGYQCPPYTLAGITVPCPVCCPTGTSVSVIISE